MEILKVSASSRSAAVAGAIAGVIRSCGAVEVQAIGAGAVYQAVKAVIVARSYLAVDGIDLSCTPLYVEIEIEEQLRTAVKLRVEGRPLVVIPALSPFPVALPDSG